MSCVSNLPGISALLISVAIIDHGKGKHIGRPVNPSEALIELADGIIVYQRHADLGVGDAAVQG